MSTAIQALMVGLIATGSFFLLVGSFGLVKLSDFFRRLHGPTKATTLGVGCLLIASMIYHATMGDGLGLRELLITLFLFVTAPIAAHLMAKAALSLDVKRPRQPPPDVASVASAPDKT